MGAPGASSWPSLPCSFHSKRRSRGAEGSPAAQAQPSEAASCPGSWVRCLAGRGLTLPPGSGPPAGARLSTARGVPPTTPAPQGPLFSRGRASGAGLTRPWSPSATGPGLTPLPSASVSPLGVSVNELDRTGPSVGCCLFRRRGPRRQLPGCQGAAWAGLTDVGRGTLAWLDGDRLDPAAWACLWPEARPLALEVGAPAAFL